MVGGDKPAGTLAVECVRFSEGRIYAVCLCENVQAVALAVEIYSLCDVAIDGLLEVRSALDELSRSLANVVCKRCLRSRKPAYQLRGAMTGAHTTFSTFPKPRV